MSAAAEARLRALVDRVATAAGIDPRKVPTRIHMGQGDWRIACVTWPATSPFFCDTVGAYGADAAVDEMARRLADDAARSVAHEAKAAAEAERKRAMWAAIGAAVAEVQP